jgi:glutamate racemase
VQFQRGGEHRITIDSRSVDAYLISRMPMSDPRPIGVFDSGIGGLSVVTEIHALRPQEEIIYYADDLHCPYGPRDGNEIIHLALEAGAFLIEQGSKLIVVACNTASSVALAELRASYNIPFVGMVPAVKPASLATRARKVLVLATATTVQTQVFNELVAQFANGVAVHTQACPGLVDLVEAGNTDLEQAEDLLRHYLEPVFTLGIDTVVLGCTHFVFLKEAIQRLLGDSIRVIDTGHAVARQVERLLIQHSLETPAAASGRLRLLCSGDRAAFLLKAGRLLDRIGAGDFPSAV